MQSTMHIFLDPSLAGNHAKFYDEMLNVLPPMYRPGRSRFSCEFTAGTITTQFARVNGRYYGAAVNIRDQATWIAG